MLTKLRIPAIVALAIAPAACGASSSSVSSTPGNGAAAAATQASSSTTRSATSAASSAVAAPGSSLAVGQTAMVAYRSLPSSGGATTTSKLKVTVESIKKGSLADFNGIQLDANQKASTPAYVKVRLTNAGPHTVHGSEASVAIEGVDDTGQTQQSVTFIGTFPPCPDNESNAPLAAGQSFETCLTFLVPGGIKKIAYTGTENYMTSPVTWSAR